MDYKTKRKLYTWIEKLSQSVSGSETLFITADDIADENFDKPSQSLLQLFISSRHHNHYLWLFTKSYLDVPNNLRRQAKAIFVWYLKERTYLKTIHDESNVLTDDELVILRKIKYVKASMFLDKKRTSS